jgi:hypothetical protein
MVPTGDMDLIYILNNRSLLPDLGNCLLLTNLADYDFDYDCDFDFDFDVATSRMRIRCLNLTNESTSFPLHPIYAATGGCYQ